MLIKHTSARFKASLLALAFIHICLYASLSDGLGQQTKTSAPREDEKYAKRRKQMVEEQLRKQSVKDPKVLQAMETVPRHLFVSEDLRDRAYEDEPLPIGQGQTISQPHIVALMTELLELNKEDKALEVGTGSGYQSAVLSELVSKVYTIEIFNDLGTKAKERLKNLGYSNVEVRIGDGYYGWPDQSPFDAIIVTAASNHIPPPLVQQLKPGGRMVIPVGNPFQTQNLMLIKKEKNGKVKTRSVVPVRFVPLLGQH